jgi:anti-sigma factor RsiW
MTDPRLLVHAYIDGEIDAARGIELEQQMAADPTLAAERDRVEALRRLIAEKLPPEAAPAGLARRIEAAVGLRKAMPQPSWRALAASMLVAAFVGSGATWFALQPASIDAEMVVDNHIRGLMAAQPIDVSSSDQHTVKPWFNGRIPEAPRVVDLSREGFTLIGGRIDVIGRVPVPTLVYGIRKHLISLTAVPEGRQFASAPAAIAGYNIRSWTDNGQIYWAVSDVSAGDLDRFAKAFREAS